MEPDDFPEVQKNFAKVLKLRCELKRLESLRELNVNVNEFLVTERVLLLPGEYMTAPVLCAPGHHVRWCPPAIVKKVDSVKLITDLKVCICAYVHSLYLSVHILYHT